MTRTLIKGGTVVTAVDTYAADVAIVDDKIAAIFGPNAAPPGPWDVTIDATGELPVNPHGGQLGEAYIHGLNGVTEAVRQARRVAVNQVEKVEHVLVTAGPGVPTSAVVVEWPAAEASQTSVTGPTVGIPSQASASSIVVHSCDGYGDLTTL